MMMHREVVANGHACHNNHKLATSNGNRKGDRAELNSLSIPIPTQKGNVRRTSTNDSESSNDSFSQPGTPNTGDISPNSAFSRSLSASHSSHSTLNVYSMSPRSTSFMFQYYSTPKGYYPVERARNGYYHTDENANTRMRKRSLVRTTSECCHGSPPNHPPSVLSGVPLNLQNEYMDDPRRRAWSESDKHRKNNMHLSRMSALKRIKRKLGRSSSLKKKKDGETNDVYNQTISNSNSLEKVEEGRQLDHSKPTSPNSSRRSTMNDEQLNQLTLHQEDETASITNHLADMNMNRNSARERIRSPSGEQSPIVNPHAELIYQRFLEEHTCYDIMPTSCKLVVFDTALQARKAFHALISNAVRSAPLWDSHTQSYVGVLTVTDFINVIIRAHRSSTMKVESVEEQTIENWRDLLEKKPYFTCVHPADSLLRSLKMLKSEHFHGIPIVDETSGDIFHIVNHKRILRFLHLFMNELPMPGFMKKTLAEARIGTYEDIATVTRNNTMLDVLQLIVERKLTAIPVVDEQGDVTDVFCKLDMISLAAQGLYHDLSMTLEIALAYRFTPLFEDENCAADAFARFSSPIPQRREFPRHRSTEQDCGKLSVFLDEISSKDHSKRGHSSIKGHAAVRPKSQHIPHHHRSSTGDSATASPRMPRHGPMAQDTLTSPDASSHHHRMRHKSLSNPLVKCRLSDRLQHVIDLMVNSDANLLVVVGQQSNHVVGVITVSDVLDFITNPQEANSSPSLHHHSSRKWRSRVRYSSLSSGSSLPSVQDGPESEALAETNDSVPLISPDSCGNGHLQNGRPASKLSSSSEASGSNDSGYLSVKDSNMNITDIGAKKRDLAGINPRFLRSGVEMERA
ncbi:unnamed protein product [Clavelina lepadiformis]